MNDRDQNQRRNQFGNLEIDLDQSNEQFMMQSQKLPGLKEYGFNELQPDMAQDKQIANEQVNQISSKFRNENTMAKSNLRQKDKTFNFGLAADFSDSE